MNSFVKFLQIIFDSHKYLATFFIFTSVLFYLFIFNGLMSTSRAEGDNASIWYVSEIGSDVNNCQSPSLSCRSIQAAADKAAAEDEIRVARGAYYGTGKYVVEITKDLKFSGGWDQQFIEQNGYSEINSQSSRTGVYNPMFVATSMDRFIVTNGYGEFTGGIINDGEMTLTNAQVISNTVEFDCNGGGIQSYGAIKISDSLISANICQGTSNGGGIYVASIGSAVITNTSIIKNIAFNGGGISNSGSLVLVNSTVSENNIGYYAGKGGGIYNSRTANNQLKIYNSIISENNAGIRGGGIYSGFEINDDITIANSIIHGNRADIASDCYGRYVSLGYNLVGDSDGCEILIGEGDLLDENALITSLGNYGGPGPTHAFYEGSPAIDGGNPAGCTDAVGNQITYDQRGKPRPLDGDDDGSVICDIGSVEVSPNELHKLPPTNVWYVSATGNDTDDCQTMLSPCLSINAAIQKAGAGDAVYITEDIFTGSGEVVVTLDRDLILSGGWTNSFDAQSGWTVIDAQNSRSGVRILDDIKAEIENFQIQNGVSSNGWGVGVSLQRRADVLFRNLRLYNNRGYGEGVSINGSGGGMLLAEGADVDVMNCEMRDNTAIDGGAVYVSFMGKLELDNCRLENNFAYSEGGAIWSGGTVIGKDVSILDNRSENAGFVGGGGGVFSGVGTFTLTDSEISRNQALRGSGGGIYEGTVFLTNTLVSRNRALSGGGIAFSDVTMHGSSVIQNWAIERGGGFYSTDVSGSNNTIAGNLSYSSGGGFYSGPLDLSFTTVRGNKALESGGGLMNVELKIKATLIADNFAQVFPDCEGYLISEGYNLIENAQGCQSNSQVTDLFGIDPQLGLPYGFPATVTLFPESPAIDGGLNDCTDTNGKLVITDQRGAFRPLDGDSDGDAACDIGSFEYDPANPMHSVYLPIVNATYDDRLFSEDFSDPFSGFKVFRNASVFGGYTLGGYFKIRFESGGVTFPSAAPVKVGDDFSLHTDTWWGAVQGNHYGLVFGISDDEKSYYMFLVNADAQSFQLLKYDDGSVNVIVPGTYSSAIQPGSTPNHLALTKTSQTVELLVNGKSLGSWTDPGFSDSGRVGLVATSWGMTVSSEAYFDNFFLEK